MRNVKLTIIGGYKLQIIAVLAYIYCTLLSAGIVDYILDRLTIQEYKAYFQELNNDDKTEKIKTGIEENRDSSLWRIIHQGNSNPKKQQNISGGDKSVQAGFIMYEAQSNNLHLRNRIMATAKTEKVEITTVAGNITSEVTKSHCIIAVPLTLDENGKLALPVSATGKTKQVCSTHGNVNSGTTVNGKTMLIGVNGFIRNEQ